MPHGPQLLDWRDELRQIAPELPKLPPAAQRLILEFVADFLEEDAAAEAPVEWSSAGLHVVAA